MRRADLILSSLLLLAASPALAQAPQPRAMIRLASEGATPAAARIGDLAWLKGSWVGDMEGMKVEHWIYPADFGQMPSFVRALGGTEIVFYEIALFVEAGASVSYRVKHFTPALAGWEAQDAHIDRPLLEQTDKALFFEGITFERTGPDSFTVYFLDRRAGVPERTIVIPFQRAR